MGKILSSKRKENNIIFNIEVKVNEATALKGHIDNIHLFTENASEYETNISTRGRNESTKYFLIPKKVRKNIDLHHPVNCQRIETDKKIIFVYVVDKNKSELNIATI